MSGTSSARIRIPVQSTDRFDGTRAPRAYAVTLVRGDGIGPEVVAAVERVLDAAGARIAWEEAEAGERVFRKGVASGIPKETADSIGRTGLVLKGPLGTPVGSGEKSANVTLRKMFETYANLRPVREIPGVRTPYTGRGIDLVVVRENVEDLYAAIEHMQTPTVAQALKLVTRTGCDKVSRVAFEVALAEGRTRVHCATKANILKLTEGMMQRTFQSVAADYPGVEAQHILVDALAQRLVMAPEEFQVIVATNMNGDILSELAAGLVGGVAFAPSVNLGSEVSIFEAVHGTAPELAGRGVANPSATLMAAVLLLRQLGEAETAETVEQALMVTLDQGIHTPDVAGSGPAVGTSAFVDAVISNLGRNLPEWRSRVAAPVRVPGRGQRPEPEPARRTVGVDVFLDADTVPERLAERISQAAEGTRLQLALVSNRGTMVVPDVGAEPDLVDHWRARFVPRERGGEVGDADILALLARIAERGPWMHVEKLSEIDGVPGYSQAQGER